MAPSHVPSEHLPLQEQNIYTNPAFSNLPFTPSGDHFDAQWNNGQLNGLANSSQTWHHNSYMPQQQPQAYNSISQSYQNQGQGLRTASPYQYNQFGNHASMPNYGHPTNVDPSLGLDANAVRQQQQSPYAVALQNGQSQTQSSTVTPQALQRSLAVQHPRPTASPYQTLRTPPDSSTPQRSMHPATVQPKQNPEYKLPTTRKSGAFVFFDQSALAEVTNSTALNKFVTLGSETFHLPSNRTALPMYTPRQSVKDLRKAGADNKKLLAKKLPPKTLPSGKIIQKDISDSESYDDSDDSSDDTDDEEDEPSPLPASRPEGPQEATRYDIIKATWRPRRSQLSTEKTKGCLRDFWEICGTIQKRWRADAKALAEAEENKKVTELPELRNRVNGQKHLLLVALKTLLQYAHPDVLYNIGAVKAFVYCCYLFLANAVKVQDYNGELPSAMYEVLAGCTSTLSTELLEETKLLRALNMLKKKANDKHQKLINKIIEGAAASSKKAKVGSPPEVETTSEAKGAKRPAPSSRPTVPVPVTKKVKPNDSIAGGDRKLGTVATKSAATAASQLKRPGEKPSPTPAKARVTQIVNKPSTLFASLNAAGKKQTTNAAPVSSTKQAAKATTPAAKDKKPAAAATAKPAFSFAQTMAELMKPKAEEPAAPTKTEKQLPPETAEEKAKRLRKESRRHLRVTFKPEGSLVAVRYFDHEPEEDFGHDENMKRDAGDIGGEGRMFKQHKEMMDDDDDEPEVEYRSWMEPSLVDFSRVDIEERKRNYEPFGGGQCIPICPEKEANIQHERVTLIIHYAHPSDIPSSPREPLESQMSPSPSAPVTSFGPPPQVVLDRAPKSAPVPDVTKLLESLASLNPNIAQITAADQSTHPPAPVLTPPSTTNPTASFDLAAILGAITGGQAQGQTTAPAPSVTFPTNQPPAAAAPPIDINALMATFAPQATGFPPVPPLGGAAWPPLPAGFPLSQGFPAPQQDGGAAYQPPMQSQHNQHTRGGHKRQRDDGNDNEQVYNTNKKGKYNLASKRHKVIPCRFFSIGKCNKGDDCTYIHDLNM
ncbi:hypothetical protein CC80DRAFT_412173 [Byssothecium circinans]|uniref:C3H1-type domain-containing protein n=1 Tax=Byssothecium circinans TaxID=147558 RepID=A0A6A5TY97_9PLEO|nr:hypothetical protein CC80DRAFT_412173 [Byssothecium circinans]